MQIAAYICFGIAGLCATPFALWFLIALFACLWEGLCNFYKKRDIESAIEFLSSLFFLGLLLGLLFHHLANR